VKVARTQRLGLTPCAIDGSDVEGWMVYRFVARIGVTLLVFLAAIARTTPVSADPGRATKIEVIATNIKWSVGSMSAVWWRALSAALLG